MNSVNKNKLKFIIYAPSFDENNGGAIVLHRLCDLLNKNGEEAYLWKYYFMPKLSFNPLKSIKRIAKYIINKYIKAYKTNKIFNTPIATNKIINDDCVVIYPEITSGNPLKVKKVVRWLLHKPGFFIKKINYDKNDLFFFFSKSFNDEKFNQCNNQYLNVVWIRDDIYKQTNFGERKGSCYMLRKGKNRDIVHDLNNSILLDGKSHNEIAKIMNQCEYFICYDLHTMYTAYAVFCGCKVVVIPEEGITKNQRQPKKELQSGIAYGFDDLEEAQKTRHLLYDIAKQQENDSNKTVELFIKKVYKHFGNQNVVYNKD